MQTVKMFLRVYNRRFNFGQAVEAVRSFLLALKEVHPELAYWDVFGKKRFEPLRHDLGNLSETLRAADKPKKKYRHEVSALDADGNLTDASTARFGFTFSLFSAGAKSRGGMEYSRPEPVELSFYLGEDNASSRVSMNFPPGEQAFLNGQAMRAIVEVAIQSWDPDNLEVWPADFYRAAVSNHEIPRMVRAGWFNYLRHPLIVPCLPETLPYAATRLDDDRILLCLGDAVPESHNQVQVAQGAAMQAVFDQFHLNERHVLAGLPLDAEEQAYLEQVTSAPADRGYAVAFTVFDGYDAERGVLLYARLFKRILGGYPFNLLPHMRDDAPLIGGLFFVAQARQQLAALDHARASQPIEWHVADAELARTLTMLLNDWLQIPPARLTVHYTPFLGGLADESESKSMS
ncbi:hypothetical protein SOM61_19835 [Massilia sp. CFBP9012]|uniref:hypothetical protein n=1 Tax=Massilia sp. CFBP9012 TaxID=3096531 RepID=UPI002A6AECB7|nr:hypothetical protein [Massilia sp. CFBP9012]MDY0977215.1 hypothetical protein [Massilia sp. CFBP9012]